MDSATLFVSDLDGTLLGADSTLSASTEAMLNEAVRKGALFSVATARTPATVSVLLRNLDLNLPLIVMTGVALWDLKTGKYLDKVTMPEDVAARVLSTIRRHNLPSFVYTMPDDVIEIYHTGPVSDLEREFISQRAFTPYKHFNLGEDGESEIPSPLKDAIIFYAMQPSAHSAATYLSIKEIPECSPLFYHDMFGEETGIIEVFDCHATKANALKKLRDITGASRVVAFGDNINDIPMLLEADLAVAVENAVDEVKAVADIVIGPNTDDSVARFILSHVS